MPAGPPPAARDAGRRDQRDRPDSQLVKATRGWIQGYNPQAAVNEQHRARRRGDRRFADFGHLEPIVEAAERERQQMRVSATPEVVVADAGYWHQVPMKSIVSRGMKVLILPDSRKRKGARPGLGGGAYAFSAAYFRPTPAGVGCVGIPDDSEAERLVDEGAGESLFESSTPHR